MKKEINDAVRGKKTNEILLFREMARVFNNGISRCTYVEEVHQKKVKYESYYRGGKKEVEIGDLLLITFDRATNELRICFLQAKYRKKKYNKFISFDANIYQWELLRNKPDVESSLFPKNILNFRSDYDSITTYGVFYHDNICSDIDFLYTLPKSIAPINPLPAKIGRIKNRVFNYNCPVCLGSPNTMCDYWMDEDETTCTCSIDIFEREVLACKIGAPINDSLIKLSVIDLLQIMKKTADESTVIDEVIGRVNKNLDNEFKGEPGYNTSINNNENGYPSAIIVITDSKTVDKRYLRDYYRDMYKYDYIDYYVEHDMDYIEDKIMELQYFDELVSK